VLRVANVCAETAKSPWVGKLPDEPSFVKGFVDDRAAWRVYFLRRARLVTGVTWLALGALLWSRYQASIPEMFNLPGWIPAAPVRLAELGTFIASAMWATSGVLRWLWNFWVRAEQEAVLAHNPPVGESSKGMFIVWVIFFMGVVVGMPIAATYLLIAPGLDPVLTIAHALDFLLVVFSFVLVSTLVLLWLKRPPGAAGSSPPGSIPQGKDGDDSPRMSAEQNR
jgi:hypothetical protein